jgi:hypothetical protein
MATTAPAMPAASSPAPIIDSTQDMVSMLPSDMMEGVADEPEVSDDETFETPDEITDPEPEAEPEVDEPEPEAEPEDKPVPPKEELEEGIKKGKDRSGKEGYFLEEGRYKNVYGNHKIVQQLSEVMGEPATLESLTLRHDALVGQERLFNDLNSGDAASQSKVLGYFFDEMARAQKDGEVGVDPSVSFAKSFYDAVKTRPDAYANLRLQAARDLAAELFEQGAQSDDDGVFFAAQHMVRTLTGNKADATLASVQAAAKAMGLRSRMLWPRRKHEFVS